MKIGQLAQEAQCTVETVRYYEKAGLLPAPGRTSGNYRHYGPQHVERLRFIRNCRALDMTHGEIRALLAVVDGPAASCGSVNDLLAEHIGHVDARIAELQQLKRHLIALSARCQNDGSLDRCGILHELAEMDTELRRPRATHLG